MCGIGYLHVCIVAVILGSNVSISSANDLVSLDRIGNLNRWYVGFESLYRWVLAFVLVRGFRSSILLHGGLRSDYPYLCVCDLMEPQDWYYPITPTL